MQNKPTLSFELKGRSNKKTETNHLPLFASPNADLPSAKKEETKASLEGQDNIQEPEEQPWLIAGLMVRIMNRELGQGRYFGQIGFVESVVEEYGAAVRVTGSDDLIQLDQDDLNAVIPAIGQFGLVLVGEDRGRKARVVYRPITQTSSGRDGYQEVEIELDEGPRQNRRRIVNTRHIGRHINVRVEARDSYTIDISDIKD